MKQIQLLEIQFPEISLKTRDAHKLRGYFGDLFREYSSILHNHYESGELKYQYPLVQYKVLNNTPTLVAIEEGASLLTKLFLKIKELNIDGTIYPINNKNMKSEEVEIGFGRQLFEYNFQTLWMGLNQQNYSKYIKASDDEKTKMLDKIITGNILSFYKGVNLRLEEGQHLMVKSKLSEKSTKFKDKNMLAFTGGFVINAILPSGIGLGKSVSRGFGSIVKV